MLGSVQLGHALDGAGGRAQLLHEQRVSVRAGHSVQGIEHEGEVLAADELAQHVKVEHLLRRVGKATGCGCLCECVQAQGGGGGEWVGEDGAASGKGRFGGEK